MLVWLDWHNYSNVSGWGKTCIVSTSYWQRIKMARTVIMQTSTSCLNVHGTVQVVSRLPQMCCVALRESFGGCGQCGRGRLSTGVWVGESSCDGWYMLVLGCAFLCMCGLASRIDTWIGSQCSIFVYSFRQLSLVKLVILVLQQWKLAVVVVFR